MIDRIDIEEITARVDELRSERDDLQSAIDEADSEQRDAEGEDAIEDAIEALRVAQDAFDDWEEDNAEELAELEKLLEEIGGYGGDHQWEGNWYPAELIAEHSFAEYAEELAGEIYDIPDTWPHRCIDWQEAADELRQDYTSVTFRDTDYLYRSA